jgi:hypothetical protein
MFLNPLLKYDDESYEDVDEAHIYDTIKFDDSDKELFLSTGCFSSTMKTSEVCASTVVSYYTPEILYGYKITKAPRGVWIGGHSDIINA